MPVVPSVNWVPSIGMISRGLVTFVTLGLMPWALMWNGVGGGIRQLTLARNVLHVVGLRGRLWWVWR